MHSDQKVIYTSSIVLQRTCPVHISRHHENFGLTGIYGEQYEKIEDTVSPDMG